MRSFIPKKRGPYGHSLDTEHQLKGINQAFSTSLMLSLYLSDSIILYNLHDKIRQSVSVKQGSRDQLFRNYHKILSFYHKIQNKISRRTLKVLRSKLRKMLYLQLRIYSCGHETES